MTLNVNLFKLKKWSLKDDPSIYSGTAKAFNNFNKNDVKLFWSLRKAYPKKSAKQIISTIITIKNYNALQHKSK